MKDPEEKERQIEEWEILESWEEDSERGERSIYGEEEIDIPCEFLPDENF